MPGYDGLALSLYDKNAQSFTDSGGGNYFSITVSGASTVTAAIQPIYVNMALTGTYSGYLTGVQVDMALGATITSETSAFAAYIYESGTSAIGDTILNGFQVYFASLGDAASYRAGFHAYSEEPTATNATGCDAGLLVECSGTLGTWGAAVGVMGSTPPEYFLWCPSNVPWSATTRMIRILGSDAAGTAQVAGQLRVLVNTTEYFIPLYPTTCS